MQTLITSSVQVAWALPCSMPGTAFGTAQVKVRKARNGPRDPRPSRRKPTEWACAVAVSWGQWQLQRERTSGLGFGGCMRVSRTAAARPEPMGGSCLLLTAYCGCGSWDSCWHLGFGKRGASVHRAGLDPWRCHVFPKHIRTASLRRLVAGWGVSPHDNTPFSEAGARGQCLPWSRVMSQICALGMTPYWGWQ